MSSEACLIAAESDSHLRVCTVPGSRIIWVRLKGLHLLLVLRAGRTLAARATQTLTPVPPPLSALSTRIRESEGSLPGKSDLRFSGSLIRSESPSPDAWEAGPVKCVQMTRGLGTAACFERHSDFISGALGHSYRGNPMERFPRNRFTPHK